MTKFITITIIFLVSNPSIGQITELKQLPDSLKLQADTIDVAEDKSNFLMYKSWDFIPDNLDLARFIHEFNFEAILGTSPAGI